MRSGMTLMSVMVAVALAGIVALAVARLLGNQSQTMSVVRLREQREELLKHYKNIVISGWDATRSGCTAEICARNGDLIIPTGGLYLADRLYDYNYTGGTANRWWKVSVVERPLFSGSVLQADNYAEPESLMAVEVKVEFIRKEHPVVNVRLAEHEEIVFLHHNTSGALDANSTQCESGHLTQQYRGPLPYAGPLYSGTGAIIQYDFESNYTKCSQVPLVNTRSCDNSAILGFFRDRRTGTLKEQLITGNPICGKGDETNPIAEIRHQTEKRTVQAINCEGSGYIEWMKDDEIPHCVYPFTYRQKRVAAESNIAPFNSRVYTLQQRDSVGGGELPGDPPNPASYSNFSCTVYRHHGIHAFKGSGQSGEVMQFVQPYVGSGTLQGPPGPPGPPGPTTGPPGPPGRRYCSCCCAGEVCPTPHP